ncbi:MAG: PEP-utilizing enzyme [Patescibacteria group bacterium]|jgi:phosphohistidine swiveling domain-containing protein
MPRREVWRKNFEIYRMPIIITGPAVFSALSDQKKVIGKNILKDFLLVGQAYDLVGAYIPLKQLREFIEAILHTIKTKPNFIFHLQRDGLKDVSELFKFVRKNRRTDFGKMSSIELVYFHNKLQSYFYKAQGRLTLTTWFVDSDGEDLTKFLWGMVENKIKESNLNLNPAEVFSILTTPDKASMSLKEEIEALRILLLIKADKSARKLFSHKDPKYIENNLDRIESKLKNKIISHYKKWLWVPYTYIGPAYELDYYLTMWSGLLRQKVNVNKNLKILESQIRNDRKLRFNFIKKLQLNTKEKKYFDIAADIIYLKSYRKDAWFYYCYLLEFFHKELAKRLNLSLQQVRMMTPDELNIAIRKGSFDSNILNQRFIKSAYIFRGLKSKVYAGREAEKFLLSQNIEKEKVVKLDMLKGTSAYPGHARSYVKIVNLPEEMHKMKQGDIMVARTTFPSLVPAMKKAAAIVTNDGGITCHAAIVARELKIPCVVGTKIATKILKDGDKVDVDAAKGIVKKLK